MKEILSTSLLPLSSPNFGRGEGARGRDEGKETIA